MTSSKAIQAHQFDPYLHMAQLYTAVKKNNKNLCALVTTDDFDPVIKHLQTSPVRDVPWLEYLVTVVSPNAELNVLNATALLRLLLGAQVLDLCITEDDRKRYRVLPE